MAIFKGEKIFLWARTLLCCYNRVSSTQLSLSFFLSSESTLIVEDINGDKWKRKRIVFLVSVRRCLWFSSEAFPLSFRAELVIFLRGFSTCAKLNCKARYVRVRKSQGQAKRVKKKEMRRREKSLDLWWHFHAFWYLASSDVEEADGLYGRFLSPFCQFPLVRFFLPSPQFVKYALESRCTMQNGPYAPLYLKQKQCLVLIRKSEVSLVGRCWAILRHSYLFNSQREQERPK